MIVDVHGHYYSKNLYPSWVPYGIKPLQEWARNKDVNTIIVSSLDVFDKGMNENKKLTALCNLYPKLWQWATIDPTIPGWWTQLLKNEKILGLKIHPTWQNYELTDYFHKVLEIAKVNNWAILTHSGIREPHICIEKSIKIADKYPDVPVIFAHLGNGFSGYNDVLTQIEHLSATKNENTFIDTSSLAIHLNGLLEKAINKIGSHRILFGTDLPLHFPESQLARISNAKISIEDKDNILWKNATSLFPKLRGG